MLKDPKVKWIGETRRTYSSYTLQAWEVLASSILWCYGPPCCSLALRSNFRRPGTISVDVSNWKVIRSFDAFINCIFPTWYKITFYSYFFLVGTLENWKGRYLGKLKRYISNWARPEGSIAEAYILKECINNWSLYIDGIETVHNQREKNEDFGESSEGLIVFSQTARPTGGKRNDGDLSRALLGYCLVVLVVQ